MRNDSRRRVLLIAGAAALMCTVLVVRPLHAEDYAQAPGACAPGEATQSKENYTRCVVYPQQTRAAQMVGSKGTPGPYLEKIRSLMPTPGSSGTPAVLTQPLAPYAGGNNQFYEAHASDSQVTLEDVVKQLAVLISPISPRLGCTDYQRHHDGLPFMPCFRNKFCHWRWTPIVQYRYPVQKVEVTGIPFNTRYLPKFVVRQSRAVTLQNPPDPGNAPFNLETQINTELLTAKMRYSIYRPASPYSSSPGTSIGDLKASDEAIDMAHALPDSQRRHGITWDNGMRETEYHVVPEVIPSVFHTYVSSQYPMASYFSFECNCGWSGVHCSLHIRQFPPTCHASKFSPSQVLTSYWGSEFPAPLGGYTQSRFVWALDQQMSGDTTRFNEAWGKIRENPYLCSEYDKYKESGGSSQETWGFAPNTGLAFVNPRKPDAKDNPCLPNGIGPYIPFVNFSRSSFDTLAAEVGWFRGLAMAASNKPERFFDLQDQRLSSTSLPSDKPPEKPAKDPIWDKVMWISKDGDKDLHMPNDCVDPALPFTMFKSEANVELPDDFPNVGIHWREFSCCPDQAANKTLHGFFQNTGDPAEDERHQ